MPAYRKKPVVIEAVQWDGKNAAEIKHFVPEDVILWMAGMDFIALRIRTLEGDMAADIGDWIIKGVKGEFYPCKPDIFAATYENASMQPSGDLVEFISKMWWAGATCPSLAAAILEKFDVSPKALTVSRPAINSEAK